MLAAVLGCGGPRHGEAFLGSFRAAQRAHNAGRYAEAAEGFAKAARVAQRVKDRDEALFLAARMKEKLGRWDEARKDYRELARVSPDGPRTARAVFDLAHLEIEHGDEAAGWALLERAIERYPGHGSTRNALGRLAEHLATRGGEAALRARLARWLDALRGTDAEQQLKYELARSLERDGALREAHAMLLRAAREHPYPTGPLTDDALWRASHVAERLGDAALAVADLRELLSDRETAAGGSYERPRFPEAQLRIALLYRDRLGDRAAARRELRVMHTRHAKSVLADDALWYEAELWARDGDAERACDVVAELALRYPGSRYRRCVALVCPRPGDGAASDCPRYIREQPRR
jgi:TolA-binding protein